MVNPILGPDEFMDPHWAILSPTSPCGPASTTIYASAIAQPDFASRSGFCLGECDNPINSVPLTRRCRHAKLFLEKVVGKAETPVLFPATKNERGAIPYSQNLKILSRRSKRQLRAGFWFSDEESDAHHHLGAGFDFLKRTGSEKVFQLIDCLQDHWDVMSERRQEFLFDLPGECVAIGLGSFKQNVAARYEGSDIPKAHRFDDAAQVFHLDQPFAADIDAAQECYVFDHLISCSPQHESCASLPDNAQRVPAHHFFAVLISAHKL